MCKDPQNRKVFFFEIFEIFFSLCEIRFLGHLGTTPTLVVSVNVNKIKFSRLDTGPIIFRG